MNSNKMYEAKNYENLTEILNAIFIVEERHGLNFKIISLITKLFFLTELIRILF